MIFDESMLSRFCHLHKTARRLGSHRLLYLDVMVLIICVDGGRLKGGNPCYGFSCARFVPRTEDGIFHWPASRCYCFEIVMIMDS